MKNKLMRKYSDLSDFEITFDPFKQPDDRWKQIFEDEFARVLFVGSRLNRLVSPLQLDRLKDSCLLIAKEIKAGELKLELNPFKDRLTMMYNFVYHGMHNSSDINGEFVEYLLPYLKAEQDFGFHLVQ